MNHKIELAHGDGCRATLEFVKNEILARFSNPILDPCDDSSIIDITSKEIAATTDSYIVDPIIFPGGDIGKLSMCGTINDLVASGAKPLYITLGLVLVEGIEWHQVSTILDSINQVITEANVKIIAGDTKVLPKQYQGSIIINTTGIGIPVQQGKYYQVSQAQTGDDVIITGTIADHGLAVISAREGLGFEQKIKSDCAHLDELLLPILTQENGITCMRDPTRGGISNALIDIAESSQKQIEIDWDLIPIQPETKFGCEMLGIDPLFLANEGKMIIVTNSNYSASLLKQIRAHPLGVASALIGKVKKKTDTGMDLLMVKGRKKINIQRTWGMPIPRLC